MIIVDAGPIVALLRENESLHPWAKEQFQKLSFPLFTCEAVISEASFLLATSSKDSTNIEKLFGLFQTGAIREMFAFHKEVDRIAELMEKYASVPMSFADACLVRMSELYSEARILTIDSDFQIYRRNRTETIPLIIPE